MYVNVKWLSVKKEARNNAQGEFDYWLYIMKGAVKDDNNVRGEENSITFYMHETEFRYALLCLAGTDPFGGEWEKLYPMYIRDVGYKAAFYMDGFVHENSSGQCHHHSEYSTRKSHTITYETRFILDGPTLASHLSKLLDRGEDTFTFGEPFWVKHAEEFGPSHEFEFVPSYGKDAGTVKDLWQIAGNYPEFEQCEETLVAIARNYSHGRPSVIYIRLDASFYDDHPPMFTFDIRNADDRRVMFGGIIPHPQYVTNEAGERVHDGWNYSTHT